ncbi:MAG: LysM peptidoglycan-binding domain-containing protein [Halothiobacillaceae bacterium]
MRLLYVLFGLTLLTLSGCAQMDTRDETDTLADEQKNEELYRLPIAPTRVAPQDNDTPRADYGLWTRLGQNFSMHTIENERIDAEVFFYQSRLDQLNRTTKRAEPYLFFIVEQLRERGMPLELALLPIVESSYQPQATSRAQAAGLWQFIPSTGTHFGLKQNWWYDGRRDIQASTQAALDYLQYLNTMFNGDWALSLAAYNAGEGTISRAVQKAQAKGEPSDYWSLDLPDETEHYVPRLLALVRMFHNPESCGLTPHRVEDVPVFTQITFDKPLDLSKIATAVSMSEADLYRFNPAFKRGVNGHGQDVVALLLPHDKAEQLRGRNMEDFCVTLAPPHKVTLKKAESLASIAKRYGVSPSEIRDINPALPSKLKRGQSLLVPSNRMIAGRPGSVVVAEADTPAQPDPLKLPAKERYTVAPKITHSVSAGDSLFNISRKYGVTPNELASWNKLNAKSTLKAGQKLTVYCELPAQANADKNKVTAPKNNAKPAATTASTEKPTRPATTYTVKKGDTLHSIAQRFKVTVAQLRDWNKLKANDHINQGQTIIVAAADKKPNRAS